MTGRGFRAVLPVIDGTAKMRCVPRSVPRRTRSTSGRSSIIRGAYRFRLSLLGNSLAVGVRADSDRHIGGSILGSLARL
jgi:hypothetical protein